MKNTRKQALISSALLLVIIGLQGCDSSPKVNEQNCSKIRRGDFNEELQRQFKSHEQWRAFWDNCEKAELGPFKFLDRPEVNKENCDKLYLPDNSFSEEHKKKFLNDLSWRMFAKQCHNLDKTKPSPYQSWSPSITQ